MKHGVSMASNKAVPTPASPHVDHAHTFVDRGFAAQNRGTICACHILTRRTVILWFSRTSASRVAVPDSLPEEAVHKGDARNALALLHRMIAHGLLYPAGATRI